MMLQEVSPESVPAAQIGCAVDLTLKSQEKSSQKLREIDMPENTFTIWNGSEFKEISTSSFPKKQGFKYLFGVRHIRYFYNVRKFREHMRICVRMGLGLCPQESDLLQLQLIWEGKA